MAKGMDLIFSLIGITLAREVPFGMPQYMQSYITVSSFVFHSSLLTAKSANLVVASFV